MSNATVVSPTAATGASLSALDSLSVRVGQSDLFQFFLSAMLADSSRSIDDARKGIIARLFKDHSRAGESGNDLAVRLPGFKSCRAYSSLVAKCQWSDLVDSDVTVASLTAKIKDRNSSKDSTSTADSTSTSTADTSTSTSTSTSTAVLGADEIIRQAMQEEEIARLEGEVTRLEEEVARLRAENASLAAKLAAAGKKTRKAA